MRHFKREFPHLHLSVTRKRWKGDYANAWPTECGYRCIQIQKDLSGDAQILVLIHEIGHALTAWHDGQKIDVHPSDHGPVFGEGYAAAWRSYLRWANSTDTSKLPSA